MSLIRKFDRRGFLRTSSAFAVDACGAGHPARAGRPHRAGAT